MGAVRSSAGFGGEEWRNRHHNWQAAAVVKKVFMKLGAAAQGAKITITFPLHERKTVEVASGLEYEVKWRGDDVIHIDPPGTYYPLYTNRRIQTPAELKEDLDL